MVRGPMITEDCIEISTTPRLSSVGQFEEITRASPRIPSVRPSFLGRVIGNTRRLPREGSMFSGYGSRFRKSKQCLRKLSCISSSEVPPCMTTPHNKHRSRSHRNEDNDGLGHRKNVLNCSGSMVCRRLRYRLGGLFCEGKLSVNVDRSSSGSRQGATSSFRSGSWCLIRPTMIKSSNLYSNDNIPHISTASQATNDGHIRRDQGTSRTSSGSYEIISSVSFSNDEISENLAGSVNRGIGLYSHESISQRSLRIDSVFSPNTPNFSSSVFSASPSASRARPPLMFGMSHRTRSHEVISSPLSYMSSPDMHLSTPDMQRTYTSALQSPNLNGAVLSPEYQEGYRVRSTSETPVFRSFRQFPFQGFENQEFFTYGLSERILLWEANLILAGGLQSQDQYRDLRLDIDSMSYEELLALEESIGNVCTGLKEDMISRCLKGNTYVQKDDCNQEVSEMKCSICQLDFEEGSQLGTLKCGHNHHFLCIEEWLSLKNQCPICKASAC